MTPRTDAVRFINGQQPQTAFGIYHPQYTEQPAVQAGVEVLYQEIGIAAYPGNPMQSSVPRHRARCECWHARHGIKKNVGRITLWLDTAVGIAMRLIELGLNTDMQQKVKRGCMLEFRSGGLDVPVISKGLWRSQQQLQGKLAGLELLQDSRLLSGSLR